MKLITKTLLVTFLALIIANSPEYCYSEGLKLSPNTPNGTASNIPATGSVNAPLSNTTAQAEIPPEIGLCVPKNQVPITLEESLATALDNNYNIKIVTTQKNRDKWIYYSNLSEFLPDVDFNYYKIRFQGAFLLGGVVAAPSSLLPTGPFNSISTGVTAQWVAFNGFNRYFNTRAARSAYKATKRNIDLTKDQVLLLATRQYYALLQSKLNIEILKTALQQTQA